MSKPRCAGTLPCPATLQTQIVATVEYIREQVGTICNIGKDEKEKKVARVKANLIRFLIYCPTIVIGPSKNLRDCKRSETKEEGSGNDPDLQAYQLPISVLCESQVPLHAIGVALDNARRNQIVSTIDIMMHQLHLLFALLQ